jgi:hypothetical protein
VLASAVLPLWLIYALMKLGLMVAAGYGMFRLLRDYLGFAPDLARLGGAVFAFGSQTQVVTIIHAVFNFAFPLVFVWALGLAERGARSWALAAAGLIALSLVSYPVLTGPAFATLGALLIVLMAPAGASRLALLARWGVFWIGYSLVFLPLVHGLLGFKDESQRTYFAGTLGPLAMIAHQGREALAGSLIVVLIGGAVAIAPWVRAVRAPLALAAIPIVTSGLLYSTGGNALRATFVGKLEIHLLYYVNGVALTIVGLIGLRELLARRELGKAYAAGGAVALALMLPGLYLGSPWANLLLLNLLVPLGIWLWVDGRTRWLAPVAVAVVVLVRVNLFHEGQEDTAYRRFFQDDPAIAARLGGAPGRAVTLGFHPSVGHRLGLETADGYSAMFSGKYRDLWRRVVAAQLTDPRDAARFDWYWVEIAPLNGRTAADFTHRLFRDCPTPFARPLGWRVPLLLAANVKLVISLRPVPELEPYAAEVIPGRCVEPQRGAVTFNQLRRFFTPAPRWVYVLRDTFPRGWAVDRADVLPTDAAVLDALVSRDVTELRGAVLLSAVDGHRPPAPPAARSGTPSQARLRSYGPDRIVFDVDASGPAWVVVVNNWSRHWRASVDGAPAPLLRANHAFQAVHVPTAGRHTVTVDYEDRWLWLSYAAVPAGLLVLAAVARPRGLA